MRARVSPGTAVVTGLGGSEALETLKDRASALALLRQGDPTPDGGPAVAQTPGAGLP